jgi:acyl dehydratase
MPAATYGRIVVGAALGPVRRRPDVLPERELRRDGIAVDRRHLAAYDRVCGFRLGDTLPATYPHVLAFPLALELMASGDFPFGVLGLVHVGNAIEQRRPLDAGEPLDLRVRAEHLAEHPRGRTAEIVADGYVDGELAWRDCSTYLHREARGSGGARERREPPEPTAEWHVPADVGRRYAAVSGDRNPIHMHALTAKAFGFPSAIAHGMWTLARALASLDGRLGDSHASEARFRAPLRIPGRARLRTAERPSGWDLAVESVDGECRHLDLAVERDPT